MKKLMIILLILKYISTLSNLQNEFSIEFVTDSMEPVKYICPALDSKGNIYLVTGENNENPTKKVYVLKYNIITLNTEEKFSYNSLYSYQYGEAYVIGDNYLFVSTFFSDESTGSREFVRINDKSLVSYSKDPIIMGYKRDFKRGGNDYYLVNINRGGGDFIYLQKMEYSDSGGSPIISEIKNNKAKLVFQAMLSCDLTADNHFILCTYFSWNTFYHATVAVFDSDLNHKFTKNYGESEKFRDYDDNNIFIKIVYLRDNSNFIVVHRHEEPIMRLRYFRYESDDKFENKLGEYNIETDYLDIENTQTTGNFAANDIIVLDQNKIIKVFGHYSYDHLIISIIYFYDDNDNDIHSISIKIYNMHPYPFDGLSELQFHD